MSKYLSEREALGGRVNVELDLSNCATKADLKLATMQHVSKLSDVIKK